MRYDSKFLDQFSPYFLRIEEELGKIFDTKVSLIEEVGNHSLLGRGKRLRPLFFILSCQLCNYNERDLYSLSTIFECIHVASLLHDDVLDNASIRRGKLSANKIWGNSTAVLVGDFLFSKASRIAVDKQNIELLKMLSDTATRMTEGQMLELVNIQNLNITKKDYIDIITYKTAELISAACMGGGILAGEKEEKVQSLKNFGINMGIAFQIIDDLFDYTSTTKETGKPAGNDIREGKVTLPLIYSLADVGKGQRTKLQDLFKSAKTSDTDYKKIIDLVRSNGAINKCREEARYYADMAESSLALFPDSRPKESLLKLNQFIVDRSY